ncbi:MULTISPECIES: LCP family glycopolymer transferase [Staphylococcus]|uniref:LytR family transcriptional regulator n=1 Tax=Staphylococcus agnetis TaxID=985762 RepID=A0AAW9YX23_9STAP|nr:MULTISPECIES: LCP family protein [Staphylococcus]ALN77155.1 LytR family transcriptional regulator [Staphylococcus agnetis]MBY7663444.1 LCP family protein [Staphylococcus agnetis]MCO4326011.1 LCP family protein [Staphylococcus agnetis]MCO4337829.1 LCP family protein [Staphylococcus agnetis]MCO4340404.1 LCP family protein [Staphylococcus agnetis]
MNYQRSKKRKNPIVRALLWIIGILFILTIIAVAYLAFKIFVTGDAIHNPLKREHSALRSGQVDMNKGEPISIALFGIDSDAKRQQQHDGQRSDTIMLVSINPDKKTSEVISIPRDTRAEIVGRGTTEKINHAYAYGGPDMAVKSLEKLMNVPIDHYATVDMDGLKDTIDTVGGIDVVSNATFNVHGQQYNQGQKVHLDGDQAMAFIRSRKESGAGGDFGRQERQQLVLQGLANKLTSVSSITNFNALMDQLGKNVTTDMTLGELNTFRSNYKEGNNNVVKHQLKGSDTTGEDGLYYFIPDENSKQEVIQSYRDNLGI